MKAKKPTKRAPKIDPRLAHVFEAIDEAWGRLNTDADDPGLPSYDLLVSELLSCAYLAQPEGVKAALTALIGNYCESTVGLSEKHDDLVKIADEHHRKHCTCCARAHATKEAA